MARFTVKIRNVTVGWSDLEHRDAAMAMASGPFRAGPGYELVQPVFGLFAEATGGAPGSRTDEGRLERYHAARDRLALALHAPDGTVIPTKAIDIVESTTWLGSGARRIEVVLSSAEAWAALEKFA